MLDGGGMVIQIATSSTVIMLTSRAVNYNDATFHRLSVIIFVFAWFHVTLLLFLYVLCIHLICTYCKVNHGRYFWGEGRCDY